jgi:CPA2 family monovalent cation:H+ antiporter-2
MHGDFGLLVNLSIQPIVVDLNLDTVRDLSDSGKLAIYGDATQRDILEAAGIKEAKYLLVTVPDVLIRTVVILAAKDLNADIQIFARARYIKERAWLEEVGATGVVTEEAETAIGLAFLLLRKIGADEQRIRAEIRRIQEELRHQPNDT